MQHARASRSLAVGFLGSIGLALMIGCTATAASQEIGQAPEVDDDSLEGQQIIYSTNADGTWSANADVEDFEFGRLIFSTIFGGPANKTRRMGVCALRRAGTGVACNTVNDCTMGVPSGGFKYCTAPNGTGQKLCFIRPGSQTSFCAGTPANGGVPIPAQTLSKTVNTNLNGGGYWISYGCFEGCSATDPSSSSPTRASPGCLMCNGVCC
jgi:hypothetical protein